MEPRAKKVRTEAKVRTGPKEILEVKDPLAIKEARAILEVKEPLAIRARRGKLGTKALAEIKEVRAMSAHRD